MAAPTPLGIHQIASGETYALVADLNRLGVTADAALTFVKDRSEYLADKAQTTADSATRLANAVVALTGNKIAPWAPGSSVSVGTLVTHDGWVWLAAGGTSTVTNHTPDPLFRSQPPKWTYRASSTVSVSGDTLNIVMGESVSVAGYVAFESAASVRDATAGQKVTASVRLACPSSSPSSVALRLHVSFGLGASPSGPTTRTDVSLSPGQSIDATVTDTVPAGMQGARIEIRSGGNVTTGARIAISRPIITLGTAVPPFFSGDTPDTAQTTYEWTGTPHASASTATSKVTTVTSEPGADTAWQALMTAVPPTPGGGGGGGEVQYDVPDVTGTYTITTRDAIAHTPQWMSNDRTLLFGIGAKDLNYSTDHGQTWTSAHYWPDHSTDAVREAGDGELLVSANPLDGVGANELWRSTGWPAQRDGGPEATWEPVITGLPPNANITSAWSLSVHENIVLANEYGPKVGSPFGGMIAEPDMGARYVRLSLDHGKTFKIIFDLYDHTTTQVGMHLHGVAWDPYWDRIWVTWGDNENGIAYSDDLGQTWHYANRGLDAQSPWQDVGIIALPDCILFGSDVSPNGVHRINRSEGKRTGEYPIEVAHAIDNDPERTALCQGIYWTGNPDHPVLFAFGSESKPRKSVIVATWDGYDWHTPWESAEVWATGTGLRGVMGPDLTGTIHARAYTGGTSYHIQGASPYRVKRTTA